MALDGASKSLVNTLSTCSSSKESLNLLTPEICVICLERINDKSIALPCRHDHFHFSCLGTWLQGQRSCPLCKGDVIAVRYDDKQRGVQTYQLPIDETRLPERRTTQTRPMRSRPMSRHINAKRSPREDLDPAVQVRRRVYRNSLYSMHVGSNRYSGYLPAGSITPDLLKRDAKQLSRLRAFTRRELQVFEFLDPTSPGSFERSSPTSSPMPRRRATNLEYLLEYIVSILQAILLKGSEGQAEELLSEYLGRDNARLFLHELENWLRSPFATLTEWDGALQYRDRHRYAPAKSGEDEAVNNRLPGDKVGDTIR
jgi:hypothetical protein